MTPVDHDRFEIAITCDTEHRAELDARIPKQPKGEGWQLVEVVPGRYERWFVWTRARQGAAYRG